MNVGMKTVSVFVLALSVCAACSKSGDSNSNATAPAALSPPAPALRLPPSDAQEYRTDHYAIFSTAPPKQTVQVAAAVESLYRAYGHFFALVETPATEERLKLILYRDKQQFSRYNTSMPWAEAFYRKPYCHAYFAQNTGNPYHWMLHEATHQLNTERAGFAQAKWINEGLATYFGTSRLENHRLYPGRIDPETYPIWWLDRLPLSGSLQRDLKEKRLIELRKVIDGTGPAIGGSYLNVYYIEYWSLSHFLFHYQDGKYAQAYRKLMRGRGTLAEFEAAFGPVERIQQEWYDYLRDKQAELALAAEPVEYAPVKH